MTTGHPNLSMGLSSLAIVGAQTLPTSPAPQPVKHQGGQSPLCDPDLIDTTFTFVSLPVGEQTVSLHFQNKSSAASVFMDRRRPHLEWTGRACFCRDSCWLCDQTHWPSLAPEEDPGNEIVLSPGDWARLDLH
jgi:hypothetical protein